MKKTMWENSVNLVLGIWLFFTPWIIAHNLPSNIEAAADWNAWIVGIIVAVSAGLALRDLRPWEEWTNLVLGIWMVFSPIIFGYSNEIALRTNSVVSGVIIAVLAGLALPMAQKLQRH